MFSHQMAAPFLKASCKSRLHIYLWSYIGGPNTCTQLSGSCDNSIHNQVVEKCRKNILNRDFFYQVINVWAFSNVYYIPLWPCPQKSLKKRFPSITRPMTQLFLEDAHKKRPQSTFAIWIMPRGKTEGKATLWLGFPAIKAEGSGDQS